MKVWTPDFCVGQPCRIEIEPDWSGLVQFVRLCSHHQSLRTGGMSDANLFTAIMQSSRVKERARAAAKLELALDKEHPGLPYRVLADGNISIVSGVTGPTRTRVRTAVSTAILTVNRPTGTSTVSVE